MSNRRDEINEEVRHLRRLESQLTDQKTLDGIKALIADLEDEKAGRHHDGNQIQACPRQCHAGYMRARTVGMKKPVLPPIERPCPACNGTGLAPAKPSAPPGVRIYAQCKECLGKGRIARRARS
jgi:hypothetical protein